MPFCRKANFVGNLRTFWRTIYRFKNCADVQQITKKRYVWILNTQLDLGTVEGLSCEMGEAGKNGNGG